MNICCLQYQKAKLSLLLVLVFLTPFRLPGQTIPLGPNSSFYQSVADTLEGRYFLFRDDSLLVIDLNRFEIIEKRRVEQPDGWNVLRYIPVIWKGTPHLIDQRGGWVFALTPGGWERIDNSFEHRMQVNSTVFTVNDTIYRFGGYGFWSARNFFTWFDPATREWDALSPEHSRKFPPGLQSSMVVIDGHDWYVLDGSFILPTQMSRHSPNEYLWVFHPDELTWERRGKTRFDFYVRTLDVRIGNRILVNMEKENDRFYLIDVRKNRVKTYQQGLSLVGIYNLPGFYPFAYRGKLIHTRVTSADNQFVLDRMPLDKILNLPHETSRLYDSFPLLKWAVSIASILAIAALSWFLVHRIRKSNKRITLEGNTLSYLFRKAELDDIQLAVFNLLMSKEEVNSDEIMDITGNDHLHVTQNIRIKNAVIDQLNLKFNILLNNSEKLITSKPSVIDKRIKVYALRKEHFGGRNT